MAVDASGAAVVLGFLAHYAPRHLIDSVTGKVSPTGQNGKAGLRPIASAESPVAGPRFLFRKTEIPAMVFTLNSYRCGMMNLPSATRDENALGPRRNALDPSRRDLAESGLMAPKVSPKGGWRRRKSLEVAL